jgi:hypothetical protein
MGFSTPSSRVGRAPHLAIGELGAEAVVSRTRRRGRRGRHNRGGVGDTLDPSEEVTGADTVESRT